MQPSSLPSDSTSSLTNLPPPSLPLLNEKFDGKTPWISKLCFKVKLGFKIKILRQDQDEQDVPCHEPGERSRKACMDSGHCTPGLPYSSV